LFCIQQHFLTTTPSHRSLQFFDFFYCNILALPRQ
jgi:hypothetical protein